MADRKESLDTAALFDELEKAATEENDSPLAAIHHIQCLETEIKFLTERNKLLEKVFVAYSKNGPSDLYE